MLPDSRQWPANRISACASRRDAPVGNVPFTDGAPGELLRLRYALPVPAHAIPGASNRAAQPQENYHAHPIRSGLATATALAVAVRRRLQDSTRHRSTAALALHDRRPGDRSDTTTAPLSFTVDDRETAGGQPGPHRDFVGCRHRRSSRADPRGQRDVANADDQSAETAIGTATISLNAKDGPATERYAHLRGDREAGVRLFHEIYQLRHYAAEENSDVRQLKGFTLDGDADENPGAFDTLF